MKKAIVILVVLFLSGMKMVSAQKIGHVNYEELITSMPEYKLIMDTLKKEGETYEKDIADMEKEAETMQATFSMKQKTKAFPTPEAEQLAYNKIIQHMQDIEALRETYNKKLMDRNMAMLKPLQEKVKNAITKVAKAQSIGYVLDISQAIALVIDGNDLTPAVRKELGLPEKAEVKNP